MNVTARWATSRDLEALLAIAVAIEDELEPLRGGAVFLASRRADQRTHTERLVDDLVALEAGQRLVVVGSIDDVVVGYASGRVAPMATRTIPNSESMSDSSAHDLKRLGVLDDLAVLPDARQVGVGEALLDLSFEWFRSQGCSGVDAYALPGQRETKNFFETFGMTARLLTVHIDLDVTETLVEAAIEGAAVAVEADVAST
jgi:ribosomal protein S18 acetylase RimI-like enzyme